MNTVPFIGGPLHGQEYQRTTSATTVHVPDIRDSLIVMHPGGDPFTLFGEHRYDLKTYAKGDERLYQLEWVAYRKPTVPPGAVEVRFE